MDPRVRTTARLAIDYSAPLASLVVFLVTHDFQQATWWLVGLSAAAILASFVLERRAAPLPIVYGAMALVFGGLTLIFHHKIFIKLKPTFVDTALGAGLLVGLAIGKSPIKLIVGDALTLSPEGWRRLTVRFGVFFLVLAGVNLVIVVTRSDTIWFWFRFPGALIVSLLFSFTQLPMMMREARAMEAAAAVAETQP